MLLGILKPSQGKVYVKDQVAGKTATKTKSASAPGTGDDGLSASASASARGSTTNKFENFGYCPQGNVFVPEFSARETLTFYGRLHGVPDPDAFAANWIRVMYLDRDADKPASKYSGGNKRKLCLAIALCGLPDVCVLDEPSAGTC